MTISFYDEKGQITSELSGNAVEYEKDDIERTPFAITTQGLPPFPTAKRVWVEGSWLYKPVYVLNGEVTDRPINPMVVSNNILSDMVHPCTIAINGTEYPCDEETAELDLFHPGIYKIKVTVWPYLDREFTIENPA